MNDTVEKEERRVNDTVEKEERRVNDTVEKEERRGEAVWGAIVRVQKP